MVLTPRQIVDELNRYIIGQEDAKKMVAVALRNRYRRSRLPEELRMEVTPKNIIMKGPTGVGKTEIARRLAKIVKAPFIKVEATKFTEVGYVGRDVESMIRDLVETSVRMVREEKNQELRPKAMAQVETNLVNALINVKKNDYPDLTGDELYQQILQDFRNGKFDNELINLEMEVQAKPIQIGGLNGGIEMNVQDALGGMLPKRKITKRIAIKDAVRIILEKELSKLIDPESVNTEALRRAEQDGIIFIDEIDKIASRENRSGADVSREGVQRDILPIVEGSTVNTKYGIIKTDYILFIAAGAFHITSVNDLIPELQGRFPVRVELASLSKEDFVKILTSTDNALLRQYSALLKVDGIDLKFTDEAIDTIAEIAFDDNETSENLGARRLHALMETLLEDISFDAGESGQKQTLIDKQYVEEKLQNSIKGQNLKKYII